MKVQVKDSKDLVVGDIFSCVTDDGRGFSVTAELIRVAGKEQEQFFVEKFSMEEGKFVAWKKVAVLGKFAVMTE